MKKLQTVASVLNFRNILSRVLFKTIPNMAHFFNGLQKILERNQNPGSENPQTWRWAVFLSEALGTYIFTHLYSWKHCIPITESASVVTLLGLPGSPGLNQQNKKAHVDLCDRPSENCSLDPFGRKEKKKNEEFWRLKAKIFPILVTCCPTTFWRVDFRIDISHIHHSLPAWEKK